MDDAADRLAEAAERLLRACVRRHSTNGLRASHEERYELQDEELFAHQALSEALGAYRQSKASPA